MKIITIFFPVFSMVMLVGLAQAQEKGQQPLKLEVLIQSYEREKERVLKPVERTYDSTLKELQMEYTKAGRLEDAVAVQKVIDSRIPTSDPDFDNTFWEFRNKSHLGNLEFLPGGKIKSSEYPGSLWARIDKDTIRFEYLADEKTGIAGGHVTFKFDDANRTRMTGVQSELGTPRYLHKITK
jgi:hypothetical protein